MTAPQFGSVDELLDDARSRLDRVTPREARVAIRSGAATVDLVDIRPAWQRQVAGEIPGALIVERNHLEWRLHPDSGARHAAARWGVRWIVVCAEGYTSSLAADALRSVGVAATDIIGGYAAWRDAGLPVQPTLTDPEHRVPS